MYYPCRAYNGQWETLTGGDCCCHFGLILHRGPIRDQTVRGYLAQHNTHVAYRTVNREKQQRVLGWCTCRLNVQETGEWSDMSMPWFTLL